MLNKSNKSLPKTFLIFTIISLFFWFLTKLSKQYQNVVEIRSEYVNLPIDKVVKNELPEIIKVNVKASGFKLLYFDFFTPKVSIDCKALVSENGKNWLDLNSQKNKVQNQLTNGVLVEYFDQSRLEIDFELLESKKVKIYPNTSISFKDNYDSYGIGITSPDSIVVSGPKSVLDTLTHLDTEKIELTDVESKVSKKIVIDKRYKEQGVVYANTEIVYSLDVGKFTEGTINLPFKIKNEPSDNSINTFPNLVKLTYKVGLNDYGKVNENLFLIECDYKESIENGLTFLIPKIVTYPSFIKDLSLKTQKIDFFIKK